MLRTIAIGLAATTMLVSSALAADKIKIGFVTTLTTPAGVIGEDMKRSVDLAVEHIGGKMGNLDVEIIYEDDAVNPATGKQKTDKLVQQDNVDIVAGHIWSHVLLASKKSVLDAGKFLISSNAGPHQLAGAECDKNFFSTSWQNDQTPEALGEVLNKAGIKKVYLMSPNYAAGKDMVSGVERTFKGEVVGKDLTKWGADMQLDFSAELAKVKSSGAEALWVFYPGPAGPAIAKQYEQAGLQGKVPLYSVYTFDSLSLPRLQAAGLKGVLGSRMTLFWSPDLDNEQNKKFVSAFKAKYGSYPSHYGAQSYDTIFLIKSAVEAVNGDLTNMDGMRAAMEKADFPSVRGKFTYNKNHLPIQNFYEREVVVDADGNWTTKIVGTVFENRADSYVGECKM
ncbi:MAG: ABC transporter substrate-binding protein [Hyphomicrobiales bacterium]|nr:ABC transporter substrate-binding protein [Hyphomicrobiales bacterium]